MKTLILSSILLAFAFAVQAGDSCCAAKVQAKTQTSTCSACTAKATEQTKAATCGSKSSKQLSKTALKSPKAMSLASR